MPQSPGFDPPGALVFINMMNPQAQAASGPGSFPSCTQTDPCHPAQQPAVRQRRMRPGIAADRRAGQLLVRLGIGVGSNQLAGLFEQSSFDGPPVRSSEGVKLDRPWACSQFLAGLHLMSARWMRCRTFLALAVGLAAVTMNSRSLPTATGVEK